MKDVQVFVLVTKELLRQEFKETEELNAYTDTLLQCIEHILADVRKTHEPSQRELLALCILAKKVILGFDYNKYTVHVAEGDTDIMQWQIDYLIKSDWRPCEYVQTSFGLLPPKLARRVK